MEPARQGREKCRYDGDTRLVAGCLPVTPDGRLVLIGSVKHTDWILPKGGWDTDETAAEAAVREAYEEAGVKGLVTADLGPHEIVSSRGNKSRAAMFALLVSDVLDEWPEKHRRRKVDRERRVLAGPERCRCNTSLSVSQPPEERGDESDLTREW
ncbi:conserved unknown protein [Ectocarpus siliculosus]|uniref:Nudix hydrolase domain-containing protein n=1 Tax=Ectocarpus siliculosus TaxID=2880 RepID=D8LPS9_ECTSI|nr:conserved unknown protein [Ectocarpus siliculosus]|eukprot:CBN77384.1 conserved unknown protein [Ectocarpus siliculosus]